MAALAANKSASSVKDLVVTRKIKYMLKFDEQHLPLDVPFQGVEAKKDTSGPEVPPISLQVGLMVWSWVTR